MLVKHPLEVAQSLPVRGAWIEIRRAADLLQRRVSLPVRGAWIEIPPAYTCGDGALQSLPVRGAWIEIGRGDAERKARMVAPRAGSVD